MACYPSVSRFPRYIGWLTWTALVASDSDVVKALPQFRNTLGTTFWFPLLYSSHAPASAFHSLLLFSTLSMPSAEQSTGSILPSFLPHDLIHTLVVEESLRDS